MYKLKNTILNWTLIIVSVSFSLFCLELGIRFFYENYRQYPSNEALVAYNELAPFNHHIRDVDEGLLSTGKQYYSTYHTNKISDLVGQKAIIFQGDSWAELLDQTTLSDKILTISDIFINGGTSSYAPSLMEIQLNDILNDLNVMPHVIIAYIDQTDFMDEACDYSKFRVVSNDGSLLMVRKPTAHLAQRYQIDSQFQVLNSIDYKTLFFAWNRMTQYYKSLYHKKSPLICKWSDIDKFLLGNEDERDHKAFRNSFTSYIKRALDLSDNVILLTHKHRRHYEKIYSNDIHELINKILMEENLDKKVELVDLSASIDLDSLNSIFPSHDQDPASHPHFDYYENVMVKNIYELLK